MNLGRIVITLLLATGASFLVGEEPVHRLGPQVIEMAVPRYPPMAKISNIYGVVHFLVQTDGTVIKKIVKSDGPPMLVRQLGLFLKTWKFEQHDPIEFEITFHMKTNGPAICPPGKPDEVKMVLPSFIEMTCTRVMECDPVIIYKAP